MLGSKQTPGLVDRITDEVFARYDQRTCTVSVSVEELYCVSTAAAHTHSSVCDISVVAVGDPLCCCRLLDG